MTGKKLFSVHRFSEANAEDGLNGDGRLGRPVAVIYDDYIPVASFSRATQWCVENLTRPGLYAIIASWSGASPKIKLFELETAPQTPVLRVKAMRK